MAVSKLNLVLLSLSYLLVLFGITFTFIKNTDVVVVFIFCATFFWKLLNSFFLRIVLLEAKCATEEAGICLFMAVPKGFTKSSSDNFLFGLARFELIVVVIFLEVLLFGSFSDFFEILPVFEIVLKLDILSSFIVSFLSESSRIDDSVFKDASLAWIDKRLFDDLGITVLELFSLVLFIGLLLLMILEFWFWSVFKCVDIELISDSFVWLFSCWDSFDCVSNFILSKVCFRVFAIAGLKSSIFL